MLLDSRLKLSTSAGERSTTNLPAMYAIRKVSKYTFLYSSKRFLSHTWKSCFSSIISTNVAVALLYTCQCQYWRHSINVYVLVCHGMLYKCYI